MTKYHVERGAIICEEGGILYESHALRGMTRKAKERLAEIHSENPEIDWESAREILRKERFKNLD